MFLVAGVMQATPVMRIARKFRQPLLGVDDFCNLVLLRKVVQSEPDRGRGII
jgi:hypothetical protein